MHTWYLSHRKLIPIKLEIKIIVFVFNLFSSIENWDEGPRIFNVIAESLQLKPYLTFDRADRHEISFKVEKNPANKSALDVARLILDKNFMRQLSRLKGVSVQSAGVGNKV